MIVCLFCSAAAAALKVYKAHVNVGKSVCCSSCLGMQLAALLET